MKPVITSISVIDPEMIDSSFDKSLCFKLPGGKMVNRLNEEMGVLLQTFNFIERQTMFPVSKIMKF